MSSAGVLRAAFPVRDSVDGLAHAAGFFGLYFVADRLTAQLIGADADDASGPSLLFASLNTNRLVAVLAVALVVAAVWAWPDRWLCRWSDLDRGAQLRWLAAPSLVLLTWQSAFYQYNWLLDRAHLSDRVLVVVLAAVAIRWPAALLPLVLQVRVVAHQFTLPYGTAAAQGIDDLLVIVLVAIVAAHLMYVVTGRKDSAPVVLVVIAAVATHFFIPGRGKIQLDWLFNEDLANLASSGYAVGWRAHTDGALAQRLVNIFTAGGLALRLAAMALELVTGLAAVHHRWFRWLLPLLAGFHIVNFLALGFWFLTWIALELVLFVLLGRADLRSWLDRNLSPGRAVLTLLATVVFGPLLFHPAGLAWLDSPVAYGYRIEARGETGAVYHLDAETLAPFSQDLTFSRLELGQTRRLTGAYGVVVSTERLDQLNQLRDVGDVLALEDPLDPDDTAGRDAARRFLSDFMTHANERAAGQNRLADGLDLVQPLPKFWTDAPDPSYRFQEPIAELEVFRLTSLRVGDRFEHHRTSVLVLGSS